MGDRARRGTGGALAIEVEPRSPYRLAAGGGWPDGVARTRDGVYERFLHIDGRPILVRAWELPRERRVAIATLPAPPAWLAESGAEPARPDDLERALAGARHALAVDDDLAPFYRRFRRDPLLGPLIRRRPWLRVRRSFHPWEALACAITEQLIEADRANRIQRLIVRGWGPELRFPAPVRPLFDMPGPELVAGLAPAELAALDLAPKRALAMIKVAREVASGRCDPGDAADDRRLLAIPEIGAWTIQSLALRGRGDLDALPAGDLAYLKLVGFLAQLGRRATIEEVHEFFAPYAPYRAMAGRLALAGHRRALPAAPPLRYHPPAPEYDAA